MPIAKELALKILGALAVGGTAVGGGIALKNLSSKKTETENKGPEKPVGNDAANVNTEDNTTGQDTPDTPTHTEEAPKPSKVLEELGLSCGKDNYCSLATGKHLSVKQEDNTRTLTALPEAGQGGKIKIHKAGDDDTKSTFSIEGGDISPTWGTGGSSSISKLEEFETYEIEEEGEEGSKKYHFKRKTKALDEKLRILGLTGSGCTFPIGGNQQESYTKTCELDKEKLKAINFEGKTQGSEPTMEEGAKASLKITKLKSDDKEYSKYPLGYQFELSGDKDITIPAAPKDIAKKAKVSLEFKIKVTSTANGPKTLSLEKVSQLERLAAKVNLTDCNREAKTCKFPRTGLNVYKNDKNSIKGGNITNYSDQTITFQEDSEGYEGEIKFTVSSDIDVSGSNITGAFTKIEQGDYEVKEQTVEDAKAWYLSKKNGK